MTDQEDNGLFAFDFDDDVFVGKEEKEKIEPSTIDYEAKVETDGWFHDTHGKSIEDIMMEQHGPNQVKNMVDHDYMYKRYERALETALEYIRVATTNKACKVTGTKEISEVAMHCASKLNRLNLLKQLLNNKSHSQDTGLYLVRSKFFLQVEQYPEAMTACITYHRERKLDYRIWNIMAQIFLKSAQADTITRPQEMRYHLANLSMQRSIHIYTISRWNKNISFVKTRFENELEVLNQRLQYTVDQKGSAEIFADWMKQDRESEQQQAGLAEFAWDEIVWIFKDWALRQDLDLDDDVKAVKDL